MHVFGTAANDWCNDLDLGGRGRGKGRGGAGRGRTNACEITREIDQKRAVTTEREAEKAI